MPLEKPEPDVTPELSEISAIPTTNKDIALAEQELASYAEGGAPSSVLYDARLQHELDKLEIAKQSLNVEHEAKRNALERERAELEGLKQDISARKAYSNKIFLLITVWLLFIGAFLISSGREYLKLSDNVILAVIGGTTINVLGLFLVVVNYLFPKK